MRFRKLQFTLLSFADKKEETIIWYKAKEIMNWILFGVKFSEWESINFWTFMVSNPGLQIESGHRCNRRTYLIPIWRVCWKVPGPTHFPKIGIHWRKFRMVILYLKSIESFIRDVSKLISTSLARFGAIKWLTKPPDFFLCEDP